MKGITNQQEIEKHIYAQLVDDDKGSILAAANDQKIGKLSSKVISQPKRDKEKKEEKVSIKGKIVRAFKVGELIAEKAEKKKIGKKVIVFDKIQEKIIVNKKGGLL